MVEIVRELCEVILLVSLTVAADYMLFVLIREWSFVRMWKLEDSIRKRIEKDAK